jgi:IS605 OrfB family transposase
MANKLKTATRSYTLALAASSDHSDRSQLWSRLFRTHHAICEGARQFGDFYLNLRGGLPACLSDCSAEDNEVKHRLLQRGTRRILALGWLSVEDARGAQNHPHAIRAVKPGQPLSRELAESLLRDILTTHKGVSQETALAAWVDDCILALTANIRSDAVIVNRAAAFAQWQMSVGSDGAEMPEQARRILLNMCGSGFVSLTLPDETSARTDDIEVESGAESDSESDSGANPKTDGEDAIEPSNASRRIFGDLFGGDATEKLSRAAGKDEFAAAIRRFLVGLTNTPPTREAMIEFRKAENLVELDISDPGKYPTEVSSSGAPTAVAKRYRKLLVCLGLWPKSDDEDGIPRGQALASFVRRISTEDADERAAQVNSWDLIGACPEPSAFNDASKAAPSSQRVFTPSWANELAERVAAATHMPTDAKSLNEFKRLMFALSARRISQTQSWTKLNEVQRHRAAVKEDAARDILRNLDTDGRARAWFAEYEAKRAERSGALTGLRITKRMIGECGTVFSAWKTTTSALERDKKTALVQSTAEKFGDASLYAELSADQNAEIIWRHAEGAEMLQQWARFRQAQYDQQRLKIPRFCHPDPFRHPTWCEFGGSSKPKVWYAWSAGARPQNREPGGSADGSRQLWMLLPDFESKRARPVPMRWRSKRLSKDLGESRAAQEKPISRADRLGLAAARLPALDNEGKPIRYRPQYPFSGDAKSWNARLQISRESLLRLEREWDQERCSWRDAGKTIHAARWFVTFAPALAIWDGPGRTIHPKLGWLSNPHSELNKKQKRAFHAQLILSRLPGLRILSVDLGHRFAAACAVWETLSPADFLTEIVKRTVVAGGAGSENLYLHTRHTDQEGKTRTTVYRRIGADMLSDVKPHPAPWARLDRQFLIKLPGEEQAARRATDAETMVIRQIEAELGRNRSKDDELPNRVDKLMGEALRSIRLALRRLGDAARIAYAFMPGAERHDPGGTRRAHTPETRKSAMLDALLRWYELCGSSPDARWIDPVATRHWDAQIRPRLSVELPAPGTDATTQDRKRHRAELETALDAIAGELASHAEAGTPALFKLWKQRWETDSAAWPKRLKMVRRWLLPKGLRRQRGDSEEVAAARKGGRILARNVGGLSLDRIAAVRELYQVQKAYHFRPHPEDPRAGVKLMEDESAKGWKFGDRALQAMERMREQRVKQLASRIAGSALGLGGHWKHVDTRRKKAEGKPPMKWVWVEEPTAKYPQCHAVVIENLTNYRPEEMQTRRENRQLMTWSSSKVKKYLAEVCQLNGLHLREVQAGYTSLQDSRTGAPGSRCVDAQVNPDKAAINAFWWPKALRAAEKKVATGSKDAASNLLVNIAKDLRELKDAGKPLPATVRVPRRGGDLFVTAPSWQRLNDLDSGDLKKLAKRGTQADLNAAANIGLKALLDPDFSGKWWFVPCESATNKPLGEKTKGSLVITPDTPLPIDKTSPEGSEQKAAKKKGRAATGKKQREIINLWRDISTLPTDAGSSWQGTTEYWNDARCRVVALLHRAWAISHDDPIEAAETPW